MVMSIISAVASSVQLSLAVDAAAWDIYYIDYFGCYYHVGDHRPGNAVDVRYLLISCLALSVFADISLIQT